MDTQTELIDALRKELRYYRSQVDTITASVIGLEYKVAEMSNEIIQLGKGLDLIAALQDFPPGKDFSYIYEHFTEQINLQLQMDRSAILFPVPEREGYFMIGYSKGYPEEQASSMAGAQIFIPTTVLSPGRSVLVNSLTERSPFIERLSEALRLRYFMLTPIVVQEQLVALLLAGRKVERVPLASSRLLMHDVHALEAVSGVIAAIRNQYDRLQLLETERARIAREMHDEIGSGLTQIVMASDGLYRDRERPAHLEAQKISGTARELVQSMSEIIWTLNPEHDTLESLLIYLREQLHKFLEPLGINYAITFPATVPQLRLSHVQRRNIYLTIKEAGNNVLKYASATELQISCIIDDNELIFKVCDNGCGFVPDAVRQTANGLKNMHSRMAEIGAGLRITSAPGQGTSVVARLLLDADKAVVQNTTFM